MSDRPRDRFEFWVRFSCAFLFFGCLIALAVLRWFSSSGLAPAIATWALATLAISTYAAKVGDAAWHRLLNFIRWW
jgi:hypothetical protein